MSTPKKVTFPSFTLTISGELYSPTSTSPDRHGAAIAISHPMTGVKEQTSANHARLLAAAGFTVLIFDAGYQGESIGEPRGLEDPHQRVEDNKAAVSYLTTVEGVHPQRIGVLGICASGGYSSYAAQSDCRIRALATVSAACVGRMTRAGGLHKEHAEKAPDVTAIAGALKGAADWRNAAAKARGKHNAPPKMFSTTIEEIPDDADSFFKDAAGYYGTDRGRHPRSDQKVPLMSYDLMVSYDSFAFQNLIAPRALLMIVGSKAQTLHFSETAVKIAEEPKELFVVEGRNHFDLYDDTEKSGPKLVDFFGKYLCE